MKGSEKVSILGWIEKWYKSNCDSGRAHNYGIKVESIDNPGWYIKIDLADTPLKGKEFQKVDVDNGEDDWIMCRVVNDIFDGAGDPFKLEEILKVFKEWVEYNE
jgi:hypothetical protein